jgi:hypothetical protein
MDGAAANADLWRCVTYLERPLPSVVVLSRLVEWVPDDREIPQKHEDGTPMTVTDSVSGEQIPVVKRVTFWRVGGGWQSLFDRSLFNRRDWQGVLRITAAQREVLRTMSYIGAFQDAVRQAQREIADSLPAGWLEL